MWIKVNPTTWSIKFIASHDGTERTVGGKQQGGVDGRDEVTLLSQQDEHEVRRRL
jgi:hypothetical protein